MKRFFLVLKIIILVISLSVFAVSSFMLVRILAGYAKADNFYDDINKGVSTEITDGEKDEGQAPARLVELARYVVELKEKYPDVVGYVNVPTLGIAYPVVQTDNNDYYLTHMIDGSESTSGAIFLDYRIDKDPLKVKNTVLYGHNMNDGSMFHKVEEFFNDRTLFDNATVEYVTENGVYIYEPLALYRCDAYYPFFMHEFSSDEAYLDFCDMISEKAFYLSDAEYDENTSLISFATCVNSLTTKNARYIYHAVLKEAYTDINLEEVK